MAVSSVEDDVASECLLRQVDRYALRKYRNRHSLAHISKIEASLLAVVEVRPGLPLYIWHCDNPCLIIGEPDSGPERRLISYEVYT